MEQKMENLSLGNDESTTQWDCPVCFQLPKCNIFQCENGHSICHICSAEVNECPICRSSGVKIRNRLAEDLLDSMEFPCGWKKQGCTKTMKRCEITSHEDLCWFNPIEYQLCSLFYKSKICTYKINAGKLCKPTNLNKLRRHMLSFHSYTTETLQYETPYSGLKILKFERPQFFNFGIPPQDLTSNNLYFRMILIDSDETDDYVTWVIVHLTSEPIQMNLTINGHRKSNHGSRDVPAPELKWTVRSMHISEYITLLNKIEEKEEDRFNDPFWIPVSMLKRNFVDEAGKLDLTLYFEK